MTDLADFSVGERVVRPSLGQIFDGTRAVHVEPRSIDVLIALVERAGDVCPKKELIEAVWGAAFVSDEVLTHAIWDLRKALGDDAHHPRFIETIPKRGYRLIAPVEILEPERAGASWADRGRYAATFLIVLVALVAVYLWWRGDSEPRRAPADYQADYQLLLVRPTPDSAQPAMAQRLYDDLGARFAGAPGLDVVEGDDCVQQALGPPTLCLTFRFKPLGQGNELQPRLTDASTEAHVWAPARPLMITDTPAASKTAASELTILVKTYLRVVAMEAYSDDDLRPWFDFSRHDTRAIGGFLEGVPYVYTNQEGGRNPMDEAARRDPDFVAPRVWRIPTLVTEGSDPETLSKYLGDLRRLYETADSFERPMIQWAFAFAEENVPKQLLELKMALEHEPENRPVRFMLGVTQFETRNLVEAWRSLQPLADRRWRHPGLYSYTASCAILLEHLDEARELLEHAATGSPVDPETFELLELLATYREAAAAASRYRARKLTRIRELEEPYRFDATPYAEKLAEMALADGRDAVAKELREFSS